METAFADALPEHLVRLFARSLTVAQFRQWFSRAWWTAESSAPEDLFALATAIEHLTYILDDGFLTEDAFIAEIRDEVHRRGWERVLDARFYARDGFDDRPVKSIVIRYRDGSFTVNEAAPAA